MLFGALLINTRACFYENSLKRGLVNLSEIISQATGLIDCGSDGERKSGRPDINIPLPIFHLSLGYQFMQLRNSFSKHKLSFVFYFFTALKQCLSLWWKSPKIPTNKIKASMHNQLHISLLQVKRHEHNKIGWHSIKQTINAVVCVCVVCMAVCAKGLLPTVRLEYKMCSEVVFCRVKLEGGKLRESWG